MHRLYVDRAAMLEFFDRLQAAYQGRGTLYLVGAAILVLEGWRDRAYRLEFTTEVPPADREALARLMDQIAGEMSLPICAESPAEVIPLPKGYRERFRLPTLAGLSGPLTIAYFDPYSVAFRLITRGDEPDYRAVLALLEKGWITVDGMNSLLSGLLPQFNKETIAQDPAEFRRKYRGLLQMWRDMTHPKPGLDRQKTTP